MLCVPSHVVSAKGREEVCIRKHHQLRAGKDYRRAHTCARGEGVITCQLPIESNRMLSFRDISKGATLD